jgi:glycosyltransferase involved in cell wall biosynthesis
VCRKPNQPWRLAAVIERPIPFYVPHYRDLAAQPDIQLDVIYLSDRGLQPFDHHGVKIRQDPEILDGYRSVILGRSRRSGSRRSPIRRLMPEVWWALKDGGYDAVWVHGYNLPAHWVTLLASILLGIPILLRGESEVLLPRSGFRRAIKRVLLPPLFSRISGFLCIGSLNRDFYLHYGVDQARLHWMPYGIDNLWYGGPSDAVRAEWRSSVRSKLGIREDTMFFVNHSKHVPPKRPADVVRAFAHLDPDVNAVLVLAGDGEQRDEVDKACKMLKAGHRVMLVGLQPLDELRKILVAADVLAFASEENWGMAVSEALPAGLALLVSDKVAGAADMVEHGVNGFVFRSRDESELARRMRECIQNPDMVRSMKAASRERSRAFSFEAMNEGLRAALRAACADRSNDRAITNRSQEQ